MKRLIALTILLILCFTFVGCGGENNTVISSSSNSNSNGMTFQEKCDAIIAAVVLEFYECDVADIPKEDKLEVEESMFSDKYEIKNYTGILYQYWDDVPSLERTKNEDGTIKEDGYFIDGFMIEMYEFQDEENYQNGLDVLLNIYEELVCESYPYLIGIHTDNNDNFSAEIQTVILQTEIII